MFNFWDNYNAGNNLPEGSDRKRFLAEAIDNKNAGLRIARTLVNKDQKFNGLYFKVTDLISKLAKIKVGKNEMAKVEDNFYGKRVVKGIFAKAKFESRNDYIDTILNLSTLLSNAESLIANKKIDAAKKVLKQAQAIVDSNPNHKELDSQGMVQGLNKLKRKVGMSRTGAKAKFAANKFEVGSTYEMRWDGQNFSHWKVLSRTTSTITIEDVANRFTNPASDDANMRSKGVVVPQKGSTVRVKIHTRDDGEFCFPQGPYSMAPVLNASKKVFSRAGAKAKFATNDINLKIASLRSKILKLNELLKNAKETENTKEFARLVQKIKVEEKNLEVAYNVANLYGGI